MIETKRIEETAQQQLMTQQQQHTMPGLILKGEIVVTGLKRIQPSTYTKGYETYQISMSLEDFYKTDHAVDFWEEAKRGTTDQGYQRIVEKQRARDFATYTFAGNQSYSNYIFSIRDTELNNQMVMVEPAADGKTAKITIKKGCKIWIVDGSHRAFGLDDSQADFENKPDILRDYQMPVSLTIGQTKREEVEQFVTENKMHKGVATDLAQHCINDMAETGSELEARGSKLFKDAMFIKDSFAVLDIVNTDPNSAFWDDGVKKGRLRAPNKTKGAEPASTVAASAFSSSLKPLMGTGNSILHKSNNVTTKEIGDVLLKWWGAWKKVCPDPFQPYNPKGGHNPNDYVIQQNIGIYSLNKLLAKLDAAFSVKIRKMSQQEFEDLINIQKLTEPDNWKKGTGYWSKKGTNQKSFGLIVDEMIEEIRQENHQAIQNSGGIP